MDLRGRVARALEAKGGRSAGWHMTRVAAEMGVSRVSLHAWVSERESCPPGRREQLAGVLGVDVFEEA